MDRFLKGKNAMVTGGASGMGRAMALAFASAGCNVIIGSLLAKDAQKKISGELVHMPTEADLQKTVHELKQNGIEAYGMNLDVTSDASCDAFYKKGKDAFGRIDILANAAGITVEHTVCDHPDPLWQKVIDVNLNGTYRMIKHALPEMIQNKWGRIINIASTAASVGSVTSGAYSASKAAVVGLSKCVALEGAPHGVTCNAISPTWVETHFGKKWLTDLAASEKKKAKDYINETKALNPQKRLIQPEEIGALALFLCRKEALGITMQDLTISGGSLW